MAGCPDSVAALSINKVCGSGLKAVMLAAQGIATGDVDVVVAGGMESMSNCPYLMPRVREGLRMGNGEIVDSMINDGLWCAFEGVHMGNAGETVAECYHVGREAQDAFAARSHAKAAAATAEGRFKDEILPVTIPQKNGNPLVFDRDESIRADTTVASLAALKPAFKKDGTVTAGNAPPVNDGASALVVMSAERARELGVTPLARIVGQSTSGLAPKMVLMTPVEAVRRLLKKTGWTLRDVDLVELNEAFCGSGRRGAESARSRREPRQRQRWRRRARSCDRIQRITCLDDAALRTETPGAEARNRDAVSRWRQRRRACRGNALELGR